MVHQKIQLTAKGLQNLKLQISKLQKEIAKQDEFMNEALSLFGIHDEQYHERREHKMMLEDELNKLLEMSRSVQELESNNDPDTVALGSKVLLRNAGKEVEYQLVDENEANPNAHKLSASSPIGKSLLGHNAGEKVRVKTPAGYLELDLLKVY